MAKIATIKFLAIFNSLGLNSIFVKCDIVKGLYESTTRRINPAENNMETLAVKSCIACAISCVKQNNCGGYRCDKVIMFISCVCNDVSWICYRDIICLVAFFCLSCLVCLSVCLNCLGLWELYCAPCYRATLCTTKAYCAPWCTRDLPKIDTHLQTCTF